MFHFGSELRNWLTFFSIPILHGILPNPYLTHFSLLVAAILKLLSENITQDNLGNAADYLKEFYLKFPHLYGRFTCNYTIITCMSIVYALADFQFHMPYLKMLALNCFLAITSYKAGIHTFLSGRPFKNL